MFCLLFNGCVPVCFSLLMELGSFLFGAQRKIHMAVGLIQPLNYLFAISQTSVLYQI